MPFIRVLPDCISRLFAFLSFLFFSLSLDSDRRFPGEGIFREEKEMVMESFVVCTERENLQLKDCSESALLKVHWDGGEGLLISKCGIRVQGSYEHCPFHFCFDDRGFEPNISCSETHCTSQK
ncbi:hypothetical protein CEXT_244201 [Caerostris extrusa]|uniref:Secreted protein n=1 Tax=Caerostris extrusa TaxID=172846 RepID=A0AAV4UV29_CAEEX|nr:hypothetical protein CEXT_244201 [Caerostris extrusa]